VGTHGFSILAGAAEQTELRHELRMHITGSALVTWPLIYRPLHNALLEDALDQVEAYVTNQAYQQRPYSLWVRWLRKAARSRLTKTASG
jgi:hypothetical protein